MTTGVDRQKIKLYCPLCIARCGSIATVESGRFVSLEPDPSHPTGQALCAKGRASPELVYSADRLLYPLRRTRPKGDPDPGWKRVSWDEALDTTASAMRRIAAQHGPAAVAFSSASPSTTGLVDASGWIRRLMNAFGTPNAATSIELCGWGRSVGTGTGGAMPDIANTSCLILWGYNPSMSRLTHATAIIEALKRGMRLIVIDPRHVGLASKADIWLRVRPGTDGALALGLANLMIERGWYDRSFIHDWSNGPFLARADTGRLITERDLTNSGSEHHYVAWDTAANNLVVYDPTTCRYEHGGANLALEGEFEVATVSGTVRCRPTFTLYAELCRRYSPEVVEAICWIDREQLKQAADLIWNCRPTAYYAWSGHEQHANATQTARAISLVHALTGSFDVAGGNVLFPSVPTAPITGEELAVAKAISPAVGAAERPLGPTRWNHITSRELYTAILEEKPYPIRGLLGFGANMLVAHIDARRGREALSALDFYAHADMFMNPTAEFADLILPVASPFEREALKIGFDVSLDAQSLVQLRPPVVDPLGESRSDVDIVFNIAKRLGLDEYFWDGDIDAAYRYQLAPSGLTLEALRASPGGLRVSLQTKYVKYAELDGTGVVRGFATPSRKVKVWSEIFQANGYAPLPEYVEPSMGPLARPDLTASFPLVLTCAKNSLFCNSQHRGVQALRKRAPDPEVELHPETAKARGISSGDWVLITTQEGSIRAKAYLNTNLDPRVVVGQHGWWQGCEVQDAPAYDPLGAKGSNFNLLMSGAILDPVSGTASHRAYLCEVSTVA